MSYVLIYLSNGRHVGRQISIAKYGLLNLKLEV